MCFFKAKIMLKKIYITLFVSTIIIALDQYIKFIFVDGYEWHSKCISLVLTYNKGVAFSLFSFLDIYLKYIQIFLMFFIFIYLYKNKDIFSVYFISISFILGGGISNIIDRFIHIGVVDYIYWHCKFDFAIFNLADICINFGIVIILYITFFKKQKKVQ